MYVGRFVARLRWIVVARQSHARSSRR
jgi:hypothetical protein